MFDNLNNEGWIFVGVGILAAVIFVLVLVSKIKHWFKVQWARRRHELNREQMRERWQRIERLLKSPQHEGDRLAIIEADSLLDFVLKAMHLPGETFALRIKFAQKKYFELKRVRWAHELRNKIVHQTDYRLDRRTAEAAVKAFEKALRTLGAL